MSRCVVIGGAPIHNYDYLKTLFRKDDFVVYCDCGLFHLDKLDRPADLIIGDFDSHPRPNTDVELIQLPHEKDDTDSVFAIKEGIARGYSEFLLLGVLGGRMDHSLVNLYALQFLALNGCHGMIIDDYSDIQLVGNTPVFISDKYPYFSIVALFGKASGITIKNAKYNLDNGVISQEYQYATSNEVLPGATASVSVKDGMLLLLCDR